jgi:cbb3-type cytochrome oxidase subunit 3
MKPRTTLTLFLILVFLAGFYYIYQIRGGKVRQERAEREKQFLTFEKDSVQTIRLIKPDQTIVITRTGDEPWHIVEPIQTKADQNQVTSILNVLKDAKIERVVADSATDLSPFGLDPAQATLIFEYRDKSADTVYIGERNATRAYTFAKISGDPRVVLTTSSLANTGEKTLYNLRNKKVLEFEKDNVKKIVFGVKGKTYVVEKRGDEWYLTSPVERKADKDAIERVLNRLEIERADEFVDEHPKYLSDYGLFRPDYSIELILAPNDAKKKLLIGKKVKPDKYYVKDDSRDPVMKIGGYLVDNIPKSLFEFSDKHILSFDRNAITSVEIAYADTTIWVEKDSSDTWTIVQPDTAKAKSWRMSSLLGTMERLRTEEIVTENATNLSQYGLDKPICRVTLVDSTGNVQEILYWGKKADNQTSYVTNKARKKIHRVRSYNLSSLKLKLSDLKE